MVARAAASPAAEAVDQLTADQSAATQLHLFLHTVKNHVHNAFAGLGINFRAQHARVRLTCPSPTGTA